jgi:hypothetical protein
MRYYMLSPTNEVVVTNDVLEWAAWMQTADRTVSNDYDEGDPDRQVRVSTVFLGLDHSFGIGDPPILWETLVFGGPLDGEMQRYSSHEAALIGHQAMCQRVSAALER